MNFDVDYINDVFIPTSMICHRALYVLGERVCDLQKKDTRNQQEQEVIKKKCALIEVKRSSLSLSMLQLHGSMLDGIEENKVHLGREAKPIPCLRQGRRPSERRDAHPRRYHREAGCGGVFPRIAKRTINKIYFNRLIIVGE